jgi:hypothetical protein
MEYLILLFSVSKTLEELVLEWKKENPVTTADLGMSQFELDEITVAKCPSTESFGQIGETFSLLRKFTLSICTFSSLVSEDRCLACPGSMYLH